jgi:multidrug resistance efflux pump
MNLPGKIRAQHVVAVGPDVGGILESLDVEAGEEVYQGQVLARIASAGFSAESERAKREMESARARVSSLEAALIAARLEASRARADASRARRESERLEKTYRRQEMLNREGATPRRAYEKAEQEFGSSRAEFESLDQLAEVAEGRVADLMSQLDTERRILDDKNKQLDEAEAYAAAAEVRSPVDGLVIARGGEVGREIGPETADLFRIAVDPAFLEAVLEPEPPLLERCRPGQAALIVSADLPGDGITGRVRVVENSQVVVEFVSPTPLLRPGMTVQVRVKLE